MYPKNESLQINNTEQQETQDSTNLIGFFDLLLKIDMRNNPEKYNDPQNYD